MVGETRTCTRQQAKLKVSSEVSNIGIVNTKEGEDDYDKNRRKRI